MHGNNAHAASIGQQQISETGIANTYRTLQYSVEYRSRLLGDELMTRSTSEVAVCCSSDR